MSFFPLYLGEGRADGQKVLFSVEVGHILMEHREDGIRLLQVYCTEMYRTTMFDSDDDASPAQQLSKAS